MDSSPSAQRPNRGPIPSSVVSFMKKIVTKSSPSDPVTQSSPVSTPSASMISSPSPAAMSICSSSSGQQSGVNHHTAHSSAHSSPNRGPLINKIRAKMASHSHRMMASLTHQSSSLSTDQLTAHLTDEERNILQKVFQKEEQFREIALKGLKPNEIIIPVEDQSPNKSMGNCRICRKQIEEDENFHTCSNCNQYVCDDCSSYSSRDESKYWMCSFCRRRGSHLIPTSGVEPLAMKRVPSFTRMQRFGSGDSTRGLNISKGGINVPPVSPITKRRPSLSDQPRQHSLEANSTSQLVFKRDDQLRRSRSRPCSPPDRYESSDALNDSRRSSNDSAQVVHNLPASDSGFKSRDEFRTKSFSASDSSNEDVSESLNRTSGGCGGGGHHRRQRSRRSKIHRQKRSLTNDDDLVIQSHNNINNNNHNNSSNQLTTNTETHLRHISSDAMIYARNNGYQTRKSSESSDVSDMRFSPPPESLTPSSEYSRSPRESADSDMLGLPTYPHLQTQRRSIPSVLVDVVDTNHLTLKDCFARRGSTGRALPKIPVEPSRSMLDLPHSRKSSSHSLDLPMDQPRRASAPEGENIRIVIDDVDSRNSANRNSVTQFERVILHRDETDRSNRTRGFGLSVIGGKQNEQDGNLYAYVAWTQPGGPADKMALKPGDRILEWDGSSLVNCSYEQVCHIIESSSDTAELITESMVKSENNGHFVHQRRRLSQMLSQASIDLAGVQSGTGSAASRRRLPRTPESMLGNPPQETKQGEILLQCSLDTDHKQLTIGIICAKRVVGLKYASYAQLHILPELGFKICKTEPSLTLEWNETLIFQQFPLDKVAEMALEISIWENCPNTGTQPKALATTVIPLRSAILHHIDWWPLLAPNANFIKANSMEYINLAVKSDDLVLNGSRSMPGSRRNSNRSSICYEPLSQQPSKASLASSGGRLSIEEVTANSAKRGSSLRLNTRHSVTELNPIDPSMKELLAPQYDARTRRKSSSALAQAKLKRSFSLKSDNTNTTNSIDSVGSASDLLCDPDMNQLVNKSCGEIKLGFIMTKGLLEIEVICARNLAIGINNQPPDTYVKIYLCDKGRHLHKRKTRVVTNDCNPQYKQTLKYDAAMIYGRTLLVSIWEKQKGFEHNLPIGATEIQVNQLELHKLTIKWYKLDTFDNLKQFSD